MSDMAEARELSPGHDQHGDRHSARHRRRSVPTDIVLEATPVLQVACAQGGMCQQHKSAWDRHSSGKESVHRFLRLSDPHCIYFDPKLPITPSATPLTTWLGAEVPSTEKPPPHHLKRHPGGEGRTRARVLCGCLCVGGEASGGECGPRKQPLRLATSRPTSYSLIHSPMHSLTYLLIHSLTHSLTHPLTHALTHLLTYSLTHPLTHSFIHPLINPLAHPLTHSRSPFRGIGTSSACGWGALGRACGTPSGKQASVWAGEWA